MKRATVVMPLTRPSAAIRSGKVTYRFDHLQPGHFYHLDLVLYECKQNAGRQQRMSVDGEEIAGPVDLGNGEVQNLSLLLDPAFYADRSIEVTVSVDDTGGALVNQIGSVDVDYRYADAGGTNDPKYPSSARPYGWLDGVKQSPWGTLPYQSLRENQAGNQMRYQFDALNPAKAYQVHFSFFQGSGNNRVQQIWVDDVIPLSGDFTLIAGQRNTQRVTLPKESYADGSVTVAVRRSDGATTGAILNEIALEEITQPRITTCGATNTPSFTIAYNAVTIVGQPALRGHNCHRRESARRCGGLLRGGDSRAVWLYAHLWREHQRQYHHSRHARWRTGDLPGQWRHGRAHAALCLARRQNPS